MFLGRGEARRLRRCPENFRLMRLTRSTSGEDRGAIARKFSALLYASSKHRERAGSCFPGATLRFDVRVSKRCASSSQTVWRPAAKDLKRRSYDPFQLARTVRVSEAR